MKRVEEFPRKTISRQSLFEAMDANGASQSHKISNDSGIQCDNEKNHDESGKEESKRIVIESPFFQKRKTQRTTRDFFAFPPKR